MYPLDFFTLFPAFPRNNKVFVAMSFSKKFDHVWNEVIVPAIKDASLGVELEPYRVDTRVISDSIITEIMYGIGNCFLFFADMTTIGIINEDGEDKAIRNGNVMYEIGIAQTVRLPEEVILFRSDKDPLLFDVTNIRVNYYNPDENSIEAKNKVIKVLKSAMSEINLQKHLLVCKTVDSLNNDCLSCLMEAFLSKGTIKHPKIHTVRDYFGKNERINSINQLLQLGIISTKYSNIPSILSEGKENLFRDDDIVSYHITSFGKVVIKEVLTRTLNVEMSEILLDYNSLNWYNMGNYFKLFGSHTEALSAYDKAIEVEPDHFDALNSKGALLYDLNRYDEALEAFNRVQKIDPSYAPACYNCACCYSLLNNKQEAISNLKKAIELDSSYREKARTNNDFNELWEDEEFKNLLNSK